MPVWRALASRGLADLSPPEAQHTLLELPANRPEYVGLLQDIGDWPERSPVDQRVPTQDEVDRLVRLAGRWRAVVLLEDERALRLCAWCFSRVFVLDPLFDSGDLLYSAWHDATISAEHARRLASHASGLVRAGALLRDGTAVLAPDHLPGSWDPRPGWRRPRQTEDPRQLRAWALRSALVLLHWADRLDGVVCVGQADVAQALLETALGTDVAACSIALAEPATCNDAHDARTRAATTLARHWADARRLSRRRTQPRLPDIACSLEHIAHQGPADMAARPWTVGMGPTTLADPALLIRRVLNGEDPHRLPRLPPKRLRRRPLVLVART